MLREMLNRKEIDKKIMDYLIMKNQFDRFYLLLKINKRRSNVL